MRLRPAQGQKVMISYASIPVVVSIIMVPMMVSVPSVFVRATIVAVVVVTVVIWPVLVVSGANVNAKAFICLGFGGSQRYQPER